MNWIEIMLFMQPVCAAIAVTTGILSLFAVLFLVLSIFDGIDDVRASCKRVLLILIPIFLLTVIPAGSWQGYKQVLIYRAINSDTSGKLVENINRILDLMGKEEK